MKQGWKNIAPISILCLLKKTYEFKRYGSEEIICMSFESELYNEEM